MTASRAAIIFTFLYAIPVFSQTVEVRPAPPEYLPAPVDSNSPAFWDSNGRFNILTSTGTTLLARGRDQFLYDDDLDQVFVDSPNQPLWIEAVWQDEDGTLLAWYHHEPINVCPNNGLTTPMIGALISTDGGRTFQDLGIVLSSGEPANCRAENGYFAGGHGDFSVIRDEMSGDFFFLFGNYSGDRSSQGVAIARMRFEDRYAPAGAVWKYFEGGWTEPGIGGRMTAVLPARREWEFADADSFWGPSIHWNTYLGKYVVLLNRSCCKPMWPQEGIYASFITDLGDPASWSAPRKILSDIGFGPGFYPQILGLGPGETDRAAGQRSRLYIHGVSHWELVFR